MAKERIPVVPHIELFVCFARVSLVDADEAVMSWIGAKEITYD